MPIETSKEKVIETSFDMWLRSSDLMKAMWNSIVATYLNVVNPNPYHSKKVFMESEQAPLKVPGDIYPYIRQGSYEGHAFIESHAEALKSHGIVSAMVGNCYLKKEDQNPDLKLDYEAAFDLD